ncbi:YcbK family protein [Sulfitobacter sp. SH24]|uniref:YcbK family protein n=1 Tax=Sulfitobacter sp. SH24 TaxID=3421173 RepID=UPI003F5033F0
MSKIYKHWRDYPMAEWRWPSFSPQEMACRGTGRLMIVPEAMDKLQALRNKLGAPMIVNSAYRSPEHNRNVGGAKGSKHMEAIAFDVRMDNHDPDTYISAALAAGFKGIGTYPKQNFVHVDARATRANWGKPFPKRHATPSFAAETPREAETVAGDGQAKGILAGLGGTAAVSGGVFSSLGNLDPVAQYIAMGGLGLTAAALVYLFRKRLARLAE